jgi:hypothetical protein
MTKSSKQPAMIHAAKDPCHVQAVGSRRLPKDHPEYLSCLRGDLGEHLVLNLIDPPLPLFQLKSFQTALDFLDQWMLPSKPGVEIHCNHGLSRAPSLALLWLAKRSKVLREADSYPAAAMKFLPLYPDYSAGEGIKTFLTDHWNEL